MKTNGYLELFPKGFGFLRQIENNFRVTPEDVFVPPALIRSAGLKEGMFIEGERSKQSNGKIQLHSIQTINHLPASQALKRRELKNRISISPEERIKLHVDAKDFLGKLLNFVTPTGRGQRGLIIAPPKTGKTTILKQYALAIEKNHPDLKTFILLVDERPEEVTDFKRALTSARVLASSADESTTNHLRQTRLTLHAAIRAAEAGENVVVLIDSLTRMARAFNKETNSHSKTLSGGLAANALDLPRRFFGAARNIEDGGSLTVLASILIDTGSRMDEVIFQEFKGTGNLDLMLSQECADQRIFPAIDIKSSGTRKEELLFTDEEYKHAAKLRNFLGQMRSPGDAVKHLLNHPELLDPFA